MAKPIENLKIAIDFKDQGSQAVIKKIVGSLEQLQQAASKSRPRIMGLRKEILAQGQASAKTVANITAQRTALSALRDEARIGGKAFNRLTEDIKKLDAQMGKAGKTTQGRRGGARQATQIAGAVISGGIFGGPEGALGAAGGAALGGVEGAFAGAAIGAQLKAIRELTAGAADYAAQVQKLEIALEGVAGGTNNYNSALATARQVTEDLNVPALDSIRGITRLTAAVSGAGGPVRDAETTFKNVTAAIKATGGSTEDVRGAITAMVQVFSKGKVSAEELSGQLGERLPGAVTLFAKANDMTLPELQKNLKAGTVGLNELMNFIVELGDTYAGTAGKIADSNAEAGARLAVAVQDMQAEIGAALIPIGAQFQEAFAEFIVGITPFLVENVPRLGNLFLALAKNIDTVAVAAAAALAVFGPAKLAAIIAGVGGIGKAVLALKGKLVALAAASPFTAMAAAVGIFAASVYNASKEQARLNKLIKEGTVAQVDSAISDLRKRQAELEPTAYSGKTVTRQGETFDAPEVAAAKNELREVRQALSDLEERRRTAVYDASQGAALDPSLLKRFDYGDPTADDPDSGSGSGTKDTLARRVKQAQELERRTERQLLLSQSEGQIGRLLAKQANDRAVLAQKIADLKKEGTSDDLNQAAANATQNLQKTQELDLQTRINKLYETATNPLEKGLAAIKERLAADKRYKELLQKGIEPARARDIINLEKLKKKGLEILDIEIAALRAVIAKDNANKEAIETLDELLRKRKELEGKDPEEETDDNDYGDAKSDFENFQETFENGLKDMVDIGPKIANVALGAIGSVTDGLIEMAVTGKANFKEMAASILKDLAKIILKAAMAKIVASVFNIQLAKGGVLQSGRLRQYANGGIVAGPTVFPMSGGDMGLMGEAGPEAVMPLKRASNGKLGVEVAGRSNALEAMSRYSVQNNGRGSVGSGGTDDPSNFGGEAASQPIDVRYTVERINSIDYVTADQFQAGMRQAADQGAKQGEQKTLKRLQMSSGTRKRLGM